MLELLWLIPLMLFLLLAKGFFSGSEIALVSSDKLKLRYRAENGHRGAALVLKLFEKPESILATTLIGTNIATMLLSIVGATVAIGLVGRGGDLYATLLLTPIMLIFGEIVPKSVYQQRADAVAPIVVRPLAFMRMLLLPIVLAFGWIGRQIAKRLGIEGAMPSPYVTRQRLRLMLQATMDDAREGSTMLDRDRIRRAIRLSDMTVGEAMIPLAQVVGLPLSASTKDLLAKSKALGHRRIPLYEENISNITSIATWSIWDETADEFVHRELSTLAVPAHYASTIQRLDEILPILFARSDHMVVAVDEFGTAAGVVSLEDLMTILLGDVAHATHLGPQLDTNAATVERLENDILIVDAHMRLAEMVELLEVELPAREFHTVGGLLTSRLRRIPAVGDSLEESGYRFTVIEGSSKAPTRIRVEWLEN